VGGSVADSLPQFRKGTMRICFGTLCLAVALGATASAQAQTSSTSQQAEQPSAGGPMLDEPAPLRRGIDLITPFLSDSGGDRGSGFYPSMGSLITGAGWVSAGPGYRQWFGRRAFVDASAEVSWHTYKQAQARFEVPGLAGGRVTVGTQLLWHDLTQVHYFGRGPDRPEVESEYRVKTSDIIGYGSFQANRWVSIDAMVGWLYPPTLSNSTGWFGSNMPDTRVVFPTDPGVGARPPSYLHSEVAVTADSRDFPGYPTRGAVYRASMSRYADRDLDAFGFRQFQLEGVQFLPVVPEKWVLALHAWGVFTDVATGQTVPFYMLPSLGGGNTLRGDRNYRWHDRHLVLVNLESRFGVFEHMDATLFMDAGNVSPTVNGLNLDQRSFGAGVRFHTRSSTLARLDVAHGREQGWRLMKLNDPLRLARLGRRAAAIPFVP
jgi:hypothetical protein